MNGFNMSDVTNYMLGSTQVRQVYYGSTLIWPLGPHDYSGDYLTFEALENGTFGWSGYYGGNYNYNQIDYSLDNGATWNRSSSININVSQGTKIIVKASGLSIDSVYDGIGHFNLFSRFNVSGNIMSLVYDDNFINQTTLTNDRQFQRLFTGCYGLVDASNLVLPATTLSGECYDSMFYGCTSLTSAPQLPAITLAHDCYGYMFHNCTSLTTAPVLSATTLRNYCYRGMFNGCTSLTSAPLLPAPILVQSCYEEMFNGCTSLNRITCLAVDISATYCTRNWVDNVAPTGIFTKHEAMNSWLIDSVDGIPIGWTIHNQEDPSYNYKPFGFTTTHNNVNESDYLGFDVLCSYDGTIVSTPTLYYSYDKETWHLVENRYPCMSDGSVSSTWTNGGRTYTYYRRRYRIFYETNDTIYLKGSLDSNITLATGQGGQTTTHQFGVLTNIGSMYNHNGINGIQNEYSISGNICSILNNESISSTIPSTMDHVFEGMFKSDNITPKIVSAANLVMPTNTTILCCNEMFYNCDYLTAAPTELRATTLSDGCYKAMFKWCNSLTTAPELPAATLVNGCYYEMFGNCTSLSNITCLATNISATECTFNWTSSVANSGTFTKDASMSSWTTGDGKGIPSGWTVVDAI